MAQCSRCGVKTSLYVNDVPLCLSCDSKPSEESRTENQIESTQGREVAVVGRAWDQGHRFVSADRR